MRRMQCDKCSCNKSLHRKYNGKILCYGCWEIYRDNRAEYFSFKMDMWHPFKLNNLKWLEEQYEKTV